MDEDRNTTGIYGDHREAPYDMSREGRLNLLTKMALTSNTKNTVKEELVLETVENFRAQYVALYPTTRAPLLLSPLNEFGCRKFISTFIRPSQLKFDELYDWHTLSKFVANYIRYEELSDSATLPTTVVSPATTMQWQIGNCIEMAILLASLLIGDGYNAYVVVGYAQKHICANDLTETPWPDSLPPEINPDDVVTPKPKPKSEYVQHLKERPKLISQFDTHEEKNGFASHKILQDDDDDNSNSKRRRSNNKGGDGESNADGTAAADDDSNKMVHAWVMVRPDRRRLAEPKDNILKRLNLTTTTPFLGIPSTSIFHDSILPAVGRKEGDKIIIETKTTKSSSKEAKFIDEPIFIEPATGSFVRVSDAAADDMYTGIESIFNKENYFVNMRPNTDVSKLSLDLRDLTAWEHIFLSDLNVAIANDLEGGGNGGALNGGVGLASTVAGGGVGAGGMISPNDTLRSRTVGAKLGATVNSLGGTISGAAGSGGDATSVVGEGGDQKLDLQLQWVAPITLSLAQHANRYPDREKTLLYKGVTVEMFAEYSEPDLKVLVVTIDDDSLRGQKEMHTFYKHRSDRMRRKSIFPHNLNIIHSNSRSGQSAEEAAGLQLTYLMNAFGVSGGTVGGGAGFVSLGLGSNNPMTAGGGGGGGTMMSAGGAAGGRGSAINTHYWFEPGRMQEGSHRVEGLRELIIEPGVQRTMRFYWKSRDDGLAMRVERFAESASTRNNMPIKVKEYYKGRGEDFLVYRSASYELPREAAGGLGVASTTKDHRLDPVKMSEKFARNPNVHIDTDVEKRVYIKPQSNDGEIWCKYHFRNGSITRGIRLYPKNFDREKDLTAAAMIAKDQSAYGRDDGFGGNNTNDVQPYVVLMPDMEKPKDTDLLNELRVLVDKETECLNEIRAKADDCKDILAQLNLEREEQQIRDYSSGGGGAGSGKNDKDKNQRENAIISIFDTLRGRTKETEAEIAQRKAEELRRAESRKDYLAPFIAKQENMAKICKGDYTHAKLSLEMARKVRDEAIADLKERLIERGHIMQSRLDKEREDLMRRQMAFQKAIDGSDGTKESEEFSRFGKEATWRIRILEERLSNYIKSSADKYRQLADKLANDKRLAALYTTGEQR